MEGFNGDYDLEIERMYHPENFQEGEEEGYEPEDNTNN